MVTKVLGEELIESNLNNIENATILRTSWVISPREKILFLLCSNFIMREKK